MKIKRYEGRSETEVMAKVKEDLGPEALILNIRRIEPSGWFKFFKSPVVEITATNDKLFTKPALNKSKLDGTEKDENAEGKASEKDAGVMKNLEDKISNIELILKTVTEKMVSAGSMPSEADKKYQNNIIKLFYENMIKNEVLPEVAHQILEGLDDMDEKNNVNELVRIVYNRIIEILGTPDEIKITKKGKKPKVIAFIGPTGVGKTTTIAKIIAKFILDNKKKVGLITADTYRIAAVEQLKTYAEILGTPMEVVYTPEELNEKIEKHSDKELLFLDTAGRSHKNKQQFEEINNLLKQVENKEVYLVLSLPTKYRDLVDIIEKYSEILDDYKIVFTKMDETMGVGNILNIKVLTNKPCSYITFGQDVPDDIETMNPEKIAKFLLGSYEK